MLRTRILAVAVAALLPLTFAAEAHAESLNYSAPMTGTATVQKLGKTLQIPAGSTFSGQLTSEDLANNRISGNLSIKPIQTQITVLIPVFGTVTATVKIVQTRQTVIAKADGSLGGTAYFKIGIPRISPVLAPYVNLVQSGCSTPEIAAPLFIEPPAELIHATSTYAIPSFRGCSLLFGIRDAVVTSLASGPDNTLEVHIGPLVLDLP